MDSMFVARNIVNQLADLWEVSPTVRQATNDQADRFVERLILKFVTTHEEKIDMDKAEHLAWAKQRALEELDANRYGLGTVSALTSLISDLQKHPDTINHSGVMLTTMLMASGSLTQPAEVRAHIEGFN